MLKIACYFSYFNNVCTTFIIQDYSQLASSGGESKKRVKIKIIQYLKRKILCVFVLPSQFQ
jgi:hypothetical protein